MTLQGPERTAPNPSARAIAFQTDTRLGSQPKGKPGNSNVAQGIPPRIFLHPFRIADVAAKAMEQRHGGKGLRDAHVSRQPVICREERPQPASRACDRQQRRQGSSRPAPEQNIPPQGGTLRLVEFPFMGKAQSDCATRQSVSAFSPQCTSTTTGSESRSHHLTAAAVLNPRRYRRGHSTEPHRAWATAMPEMMRPG